MRLPANHHLPFIVGANPFWSMSLVHCTAALASPHLTVLDVGANVGDSVVLLESRLPGRCNFICVEPNAEWLPYLNANTAGLPVQVIHRFIGEGQRLVVRAGDPGTAGSRVSESGEPSIPLDEICSGQHVDLIKVDTDGFDFPILRSGSQTLRSARPALFFEWDVKLWRDQGEDPERIFPWLAEHGYDDLCFFGDSGLFYCRTSASQLATLRSLIAVAESRREMDRLYWDVFAAPGEVCDRAIQNSVAAAQKLAAEIPLWHRVQPVFWQ